MTKFTPIREVPLLNTDLGREDLLVVFGELFDRGYANGIVDYAKSLGMKVVFSTVGRRTPEQELRPLTADELSQKDQPLINVPLEAGFDLDADKKGARPVDQLKGYGLTGWENAELNWDSIEQCRAAGRDRFQNATRRFVEELKVHTKSARKVLFLHTMAGGFPRAKVVLPIANKVFKGSGDRFQSSEVFWKSEIGRLCDWNFNEVTANTFHVLIEETASLRDELKSRGGEAAYLAFGYHGNEVMIGETFKWYSYSPYLQGWAKLLLETHALSAQKNGVKASVYNVPEILTNSSSIFLGVEVVLYPLLRAFIAQETHHPITKSLLASCEQKLKDPYTYSDIDALTQAYLHDPDVISWPKFETWPQHNAPVQMAKMRDTSTKLLEMHKDRKDLMTSTLSEVVFKVCGTVMLRQAFIDKPAVQWIGHDLVSRCALAETLL